jgi:NAD(P)-dependent dehydrogenase (short-subunit alcohol dehydrogenase family)
MNVFITGISRGLGRALASHYAADNNQVFGVSRSVPSNLHSLVAHCSMDIGTTNLTSKIADFCAGVDHIDLLINNAGVESSGVILEKVAAVDVIWQFKIHCVGPLQVTQALLPKLRAAPVPKVINITSRLGSITQHLRGDFIGKQFSYAYRIAKAAQNMLSVCMAADSSLSGILVASVNPGLVRTSMGTEDAIHSPEEAAIRIAELIRNISSSGIYHAFGQEALY